MVETDKGKLTLRLAASNEVTGESVHCWAEGGDDTSYGQEALENMRYWKLVQKGTIQDDNDPTETMKEIINVYTSLGLNERKDRDIIKRLFSSNKEETILSDLRNYQAQQVAPAAEAGL